MPGIQDIANGLGKVYVVNLAGTIIGTMDNTIANVRQLRSIGAQCAPISSDRPAIGTVTITAAGGAGNITAVTINGVNQIGANVAATVGDVVATASDIADAINSWTAASGPNYTAQAILGVLYIFSPPASGTAVNGQAITVSVSNILITSTTTPMTNGADGSGAYDSVVGLRFYVNADYTSPVPTNSVASALEITEQIVGWGLQSGIRRIAATIASDAITSLSRSTAIQEIIVSTQGGAATDYLGYINPSAFSPGDKIRLISSSLAQVTTVIDSTDTSSPLLQRNITLVDATPFVLRQYQGINLVLTYDNTGGLVWMEDTRAFSTGLESITRADLLALQNASQLTATKQWLVTDVGPAGIIVTAATANRLELGVTYLALVPDWQNTSTNFGGGWSPVMVAPTLGLMYNYNQLMYESLTAAIGTAPDGDAVNWVLVPYSSGEYISEIHYAEYDIVTNWFSLRRDKRGNEIRQDFQNRYALAKNPDACMCWGNNRVTNTVIDNAAAQIQNYIGIAYANKFLSGSTVTNFYSTTTGTCFGNTIEQGADILDVYADAFNNNYIGGNSNFSAFGNASTVASGSFQFMNIFEAQIAGDGASAVTMVRLNAVGLNNNPTTLNITGTCIIGGITLERSFDVLIASAAGSLGANDLYFKQNCTATLANVTGTSTFQNIIVQENVALEFYAENTTIELLTFNVDAIVGTLADPVVVAMSGVVADDIDLDDAGIYSGTALTLPDRYAKSGGVFRLIATAATATIDEIQNAIPSTTALDNNKLLYGFYCESGLTATFDGTVIGSAADGDYVSNAATDVVVGNASTALASILYMYAVELSPGVNIMRKDTYVALI